MFERFINIIESVMLTYVLYEYTERKDRKTVLLSLTYFFLSFFYISTINNYNIPEILVSFIDVLLAFGYLSLTSSYTWSKKLFYGEMPFTIMAISSISLLMSFSILLYSKTDYPLLIHNHQIPVFIVIKTVQAIFLYMSIKWIRRMNSLTAKDYIISAVLLLLCRYVIMCLQMVLLTESNTSYYMLLSVFLIILIFYLMIKLFLSVHDHIMFEKNQEIQIRRLSEKASTNQKILEAEESIRKMRHDMKHFIQGLKETVSVEDKVKIQNTIERYEKEVLQIPAVIVTKDEILNNVLNIKKDQAVQKGIDFSCNIHLMDPFDMDEGDLYLLISNILDNAIMHIGMEKKIRVEINQQAEMAVISVTNSTDELIANVDGGFRDESYINKGFGIKTIQEISDKYNTISSFSQNGYEFTCSTLLPVKFSGHID